jgi:Fe2+ transport system protein B
MSTMAVMKREIGSWTWPIALFFIYGLIAYIGAYAVFNIANQLLIK